MGAGAGAGATAVAVAGPVMTPRLLAAARLLVLPLPRLPILLPPHPFPPPLVRARESECAKRSQLITPFTFLSR